ncbi:MAG: glycoside hydrolase family 127 protein, partial [Solirubrobacterales bacterium]
MRNRSRQVLVATLAIAFAWSLCAAQEPNAPLARDYNVTPVPFNLVHVQDGFWTPRLQTNQLVTLPYCFQKCEETGRIRNFEKAAGLRQGKHEGIFFDDSDVYKIMEGAAYSLQVHPDVMLRMYLDKLITIMAAAQWPDGYLYTFYSLPEKQPQNRWINEKDMHEQYCIGHMLEAAVAHYQVTDNKAFLDVATKCADYVCGFFGPGKRTDPPGHQEIEIALCKLYRVTGNAKYLDTAKFLLDQRGRLGNRGPDGKAGLYSLYSQDHIPVTEQTEAVGHSVRAAYMYTGMADVAALTGDMKYVDAIDKIWNDVATTKLYITGGIGAAGGSEGFGGKYELPNQTAYCETCASFANVFWNHRMFLMRGDAKYIDVLERTLYNAALSGISMKGDTFFYPNVLESTGGHERSPWFDCSCCPSNVARFIPSMPGYIYATKGNDLYVNLYVGGDATLTTAGNKIRIRQATEYPWKGRVDIALAPEKSDAFAVLLRIPGWARNEVVPSDLYTFADRSDEKPSIKINGKPVPFEIDKGYARIERTWLASDRLTLELPMPIRRIVSHPEIKTNAGRVAFQRGPIVFCLEGPDNDGEVLSLVIPDDAKLKSEFKSDLLNGVVVLTGKAQTLKRSLGGKTVPGGTRSFTAIPYYAWAHRGRAQMTVWPACMPQAARPAATNSLAHASKLTASFVHKSLDAVKDQNLPQNSADGSQQFDFWNHKGTTEWLQFEWNKPQKVSGVRVYWFDDTGSGECRVPQSWQVLYRTIEGDFKPVTN